MTDTVTTMSTLILALFAALGFFLLIAGVQLVGLIAAFTGGVLGWCIGGFIHDSFVPEWSPAICAATASVGCAALAALFVRPAVAVGFAAAGTIIGLLFAGLLVERGIAPTAPLPSAKSSANVTQEATPSASVRAARSGLTDRESTRCLSCVQLLTALLRSRVLMRLIESAGLTARVRLLHQL